MRVHGIDVSTFQDDSTTPRVIDWSKPKTRGVRFVINRLTSGAVIDADFVLNYSSQTQYGYIRGGYGWWDYRDGAPADAVQGRAAGEVERAYPSEMPVVWCDWEQPGKDWPPLPPRAQCLAKMKLYKDAIELASGKRAGAYMNPAMIQHLTSEYGIFVPLPDWLRAMPLWIAAWPKLPAGMTLEEFIAYIEGLGFNPNTLDQWERFLFWQAGTPPYGLELGMDGSKDIDWDTFNGTEDQFMAWLQSGEMMANHYKDNAIGYYAKTTSDAGWGNSAFDFFVLHGGAGYEQPNAQLKPMEDLARSKGKHVVIEYTFQMGYYTGQQYTMKDDHWPNLAMDAPLKAFIDVMTGRNPDAVVITYLDARDHTGNPGDPAWVEFTGRNFINKAKAWLGINKPNAKVFIRTSHKFLAESSPASLSWIHQHETIVDQSALSPLDESYPQADDKPAHVGASDGWEFWSYRPTIYLYKGTPAQLATALGKTTPPPQDTTPPAVPAGLTAQTAGLAVSLSWSAVTDAAGYKVYRNGVQIAQPAQVVYVDSVSAAGTYAYQVSAYDAAGNESAKSAQVAVIVSVTQPPADAQVLELLNQILARQEVMAAEQQVQGEVLAEVRAKFS